MGIPVYCDYVARNGEKCGSIAKVNIALANVSFACNKHRKNLEKAYFAKLETKAEGKLFEAIHRIFGHWQVVIKPEELFGQTAYFSEYTLSKLLQEVKRRNEEEKTV